MLVCQFAGNSCQDCDLSADSHALCIRNLLAAVAVPILACAGPCPASPVLPCSVELCNAVPGRCCAMLCCPVLCTLYFLLVLFHVVGRTRGQQTKHNNPLSTYVCVTAPAKRARTLLPVGCGHPASRKNPCTPHSSSCSFGCILSAPLQSRCLESTLAIKFPWLLLQRK